MLRINRGKRIYENLIFLEHFSSIIPKHQPNGWEIVMDGSNFDIQCNGKLKLLTQIAVIRAVILDLVFVPG